MVEIILGGLSLQVSSSGWFISTDSKLRSDYYIQSEASYRSKGGFRLFNFYKKSRCKVLSYFSALSCPF